MYKFLFTDFLSAFERVAPLLLCLFFFALCMLPTTNNCLQKKRAISVCSVFSLLLLLLSSMCFPLRFATVARCPYESSCIFELCIGVIHAIGTQLEFYLYTPINRNIIYKMFHWHAHIRDICIKIRLFWSLLNQPIAAFISFWLVICTNIFSSIELWPPKSIIWDVIRFMTCDHESSYEKKLKMKRYQMRINKRKKGPINFIVYVYCHLSRWRGCSIFFLHRSWHAVIYTPSHGLLSFSPVWEMTFRSSLTFISIDERIPFRTNVVQTLTIDFIAITMLILINFSLFQFLTAIFNLCTISRKILPQDTFHHSLVQLDNTNWN